MKKHVAKKLSLSRETLHRLTTSSLVRVGGGTLEAGADAVDKPLSIPGCTNVISDCLGCTTPLASCPPSMFSYCTCA